MKYVKELNLELGHPSVDEAMRRLTAELSACRHMHTPVLKIIHGYGSSGKGGKIRTACRRCLSQARERGEVALWLPGERFSIFEEEARQMLNCCGALRQDPDLERYNNGVTFVLF
jgi:hypothetical protein